MLNRCERLSRPVFAFVLSAFYHLSCGNFATQSENAAYYGGGAGGGGDSDSDSDSDSDGDADTSQDIDADGNNDLTALDTDTDTDVDSDGDEDSDSTPAVTNAGWPCPTTWSSYSCTTRDECEAWGGRIPGEYTCTEGGICCDTTPVVEEGGEACPEHLENVSCEFSWECWKAGGELLYEDYYCTGDNTMCCRSVPADPVVEVTITSHLSDCGGLPEKQRSEVMAGTWAVPYCDAEVIHWRYNAARSALSILDARVELNCCGAHDLTMSRLADGSYLVTEIDNPGEGGRCDCTCAFDYQLTAEGIPNDPIGIKIVRQIGDKPGVLDIWQDEWQPSQVGGAAIVDFSDGASWCEEAPQDTALDEAADAGLDAGNREQDVI
jgi:hypothetical protein